LLDGVHKIFLKSEKEMQIQASFEAMRT
jgi:hypothetical protein